MPSIPHVAIIGGGPAGLMAAERLAAAHIRVTVYERKPTAARKFLMAGRGGLNLTHSEPLPAFITRYGAAADWLSPYIHAFTPNDLRTWCEDLGEKTFVGSSGRVFPESFKASPLLRAWQARLIAAGVTFAFGHDWLGWDADGALLFRTTDGTNSSVTPDATLLALGGASWPRLGADGGWVPLLQAKNIPVRPLVPANCGFTCAWSDIFRTRFAGHPLKPVTLRFAGHTVVGEAMMTDRGIEGGAVYALSSALRDAIAADGQAMLHLDLRPGLTLETLTEKLSAPRQAKSFSNFLRSAAGLSPLAVALLYETSTKDAPQKMSASALAAHIKSAPLTLHAPFGLERAISSAGGLARDAVDDHFMLRALPGVFAAGEMLDWEAPTGGYLLQASFSTAVAAAEGVIRRLTARN